jgi:hypothetical protein
MLLKHFLKQMLKRPFSTVETLLKVKNARYFSSEVTCVLAFEFWMKQFIYLQLNEIAAGMIISIVSASAFLVCFFLCCKSSSKSRVWIFGKEHMIVILKLHLISIYELLVHYNKSQNLMVM